MPHDPVYLIARSLLRIDNRSDSDLASACSLTSKTIARIRAGEGTFLRSSTVAAIAKATRKQLVTRNAA